MVSPEYIKYEGDKNDYGGKGKKRNEAKEGVRETERWRKLCNKG